MGCFSFLCSGCGDPINSDGTTGEHCILFLVKQDEVLEWMQGQYDSYGRVFNPNFVSSNERHWHKWSVMDWDAICDLIFDDDSDSGIAAYHTGCIKPHYPIEVSESDPDQGWGKYKHTILGSFQHGVVTPTYKTASSGTSSKCASTYHGLHQWCKSDQPYGPVCVWCGYRPLEEAS